MSSVASFVFDVEKPGVVELDGDALRHALVRRVAPGDAVRLVSGRGDVADGVVREAVRKRVSVDVRAVKAMPRPMTLEVLVPVADKERMLWAAEKCVEFQVTAWRPVMYHRSRSVSPRGEGEKFREKVLSRMGSALEQCGGAWLPEIHPEVELSEAMAQTPHANRILLDVSGSPLVGHPGRSEESALAVAVGPEGGLEDSERQQLLGAGWIAASLASTTLRFETAIISAVAVIRAAQLASRS